MSIEGGSRVFRGNPKGLLFVIPMIAWAVYAHGRDNNQPPVSQTSEGNTPAAIVSSPYSITGTQQNGREGVYLSAQPFLKAEHIGQKLLDGAQVEVACQTIGDEVANDDTWDRVVLYDQLQDHYVAAYVPDVFVNTAKDLASGNGYPSCA